MSTLSFQRWLVIVNGLVPCVLLLWDAVSGQLGANSVNIALHITGILSLVFLILSLLITPLKRLTKWGNWIAFRRALGLYGFFYAVLHTTIYVAFDRSGSVAGTIHEISARRFLQVGALAVLLMVPLAITSTNSMIRRLGSQRWKKLHRLAYPIAILGVLHYYMLVKSDVRVPLAFAAVLGVLLGSRMIRTSRALPGTASSDSPRENRGGNVKNAVQRWNGQLRVIETRAETHNVRTIRLASTQSGRIPFDFLPGQFLNIQVLINDQRVNRSYTIASSPTQKQWIELTVKREPMGKASSFLHESIRVGDLLSASGPAGRFVFMGENSASVVLIAGGVGITPVMSIVRYLTETRWTGDIYLVLSAKTQNELIFRDEIEALVAKYSSLHVCATLTQCLPDETWDGERGRISVDLLSRFVPNLRQHPIYICGPTAMAGSIREILATMGVSENQVRVEAFGGPKSISVPATPGIVTGNGRDDASEDVVDDGATSTPGITVEFIQSGKTVESSSGASILEVAEQSGIALDFECRAGICGQCRVRLMSGSVLMACQDALTEADRRSGIVLGCQAIPTSSVSVDL